MAAGRRVPIKCHVRGERAGYLDMARRNANMHWHRPCQPGCAGSRAESLRVLLACRSRRRAECSTSPHQGEAPWVLRVFDAMPGARQYRPKHHRRRTRRRLRAMRQALERGSGRHRAEVLRMPSLCHRVAM